MGGKSGQNTPFGTRTFPGNEAMKTISSTLKKVIFAIIPCLALFAFGEVIMVLSGWDNSLFQWNTCSGSPCNTPHGKVAYRRGVMPWCKRYETNLNNIGLRGEDVSNDKKEIRILFVGDSLTFGVGVHDEKVFCVLTQSLLGKHNGLKIINGGVPGYGINDEIVQTKRLFDLVQPDLVLLFFYENDIFDILKTINPEQYKIWESERFTPLKRSALLWSMKMIHYNFVYKHGQMVFPYSVHPLELKDDIVTIGWKNYFDSVDKLRNFVESNGAKFGLVVIPDYMQVVSDVMVIEKQFDSYADKSGVPTLKLLDVWKDNRELGLTMIPNDGHPNELGHRLFAQALSQWIPATFFHGRLERR